MAEPAGIDCPTCGSANSADAMLCTLCSEVLHRQARAAAPRPASQNRAPLLDFAALKDETPSAAPKGLFYRLPPTPKPERKSWEDPVFKTRSGRHHVGLGLALACLFCLPFFLFRSIGWVFESVVHEMGHTLMAYLMGSIALPALRLDGHAATVHLDQWPALACLVWALLVAAAGVCFRYRHRPLLISFGVLAVIYPLFAFTEAKEFLHLISGHGGELVIATIFLWRSMVPGKVLEEERTLYATLGWYLWLQNLFLTWNLTFSEASRSWYLENGSFGLENDYVRIADSFSWSLPFLAGVMLLVCLAVPPLGLLWGRWTVGRQAT